MPTYDALFPDSPAPTSAAPPTPVRTPSTPSTPAVPAVPAVPTLPTAVQLAPSSTEVSIEDLRNLGPCAYLCGPAGTGKTTLARQLAEFDDTLLCATTGIAAVNLGAVTLNATLGYYDTDSLIACYAEGRLQMRLRGLLKMGVRTLVIDEVSMMDGKQLEVLQQAIDDVATTAAYDADLEQVTTVEHEDRRMKVLLVGDFAQLPPIKAKFAFQSAVWDRFADDVVKLSTIRRQDEQRYVEALQAVRRGDPRAALPTLKPRFAQQLNLKDFAGTTIVAKNDAVDRINAIRHLELPGSPIVWKSIRSGEQMKEWTTNIPQEASVKPGALVMILANRYTEDFEEREIIYANGDTGEVREKEGDTGIRVFLHRTKQEVVVVPVTREWKEPYRETEEEKADRIARGEKLGVKLSKPKHRIRGSLTYMPLRLAWATTVHKSQGLSLDRVQIGLADWMFSRPGMTYVALSRCRTLEGLTLVASERTFLEKCSVDPVVKPWI
jgi:ATP-dependent DNA helicase PIF1